MATLLALGAWVAFRSPCLGVSDNLDYWRVMRPAGIAHLEPVRRPGAFVQCHYVVSEADLGSGFSSPALMAWLAKLLGPVFRQAPGRMDVRQTGTLYLALLGGLVVAARRWRVAPLLAAGWLFVLVDPGYLLFANSFYADPALLVGLLGIGYWFARASDGEAASDAENPWSPVRVVVLVLLVFLGGASKMQYVVLPAIVFVVGTGMAWRGGPVGRARPVLDRRSVPGLAALSVLAVVIPLHFFVGTGPRFLEVNNYHAVYAGILQATAEPERALELLGIPRDEWELPRKDVWSAGISPDHPVHDALRSLSRWRLLWLYGTDPAAIRATLRRIEESLGTTEVHRRGTYPRTAGRRPGAQYRPSWAFSRLHGALFGAFPPLLWVLLATALAWSITAAILGRSSGPSLCAALLALFALSQFVVVVLGDGFVAFEQHLVGARFAVDLLVVLLANAGVTFLYRRLPVKLRLKPTRGNSPGSARRT